MYDRVRCSGLETSKSARHKTKQGYLWIVDRSLMVTEKLNPCEGISKDVVLSLSQSKVAERRQEQ